MKTVTIAEAKTKVGFVIEGVTGVVQKIFPRKTGETAKNGKTFTWSIQNGELSDDTGIIKFTIFGAVDEMPQSWKGKTITFLSTQGRGGWNGVFVENNEYNGKVTVQLKIDKTAKVVEGTPQEAFENNQISSGNGTRNDQNVGLIQTQHIPPNNTLKPNLDEMIGKYGFLYQKCVEQAAKIEGVTEESNIKDVATTFWIQSMRDGLINNIECDIKHSDESSF